MKLRLSERADTEYDAIRQYLLERNPSAASGFARRLDAVVQALLIYPEIGEETEHSGIRRMVMRNYPYIVYYKHVGEQLEILSIFHTAQDPDQAPEG